MNLGGVGCQVHILEEGVVLWQSGGLPVLLLKHQGVFALLLDAV